MSNQPESFRGHLPALAGSIVGTLLSAVAGSHIGGALGTRYALIVGAFLSGSVSWWAERVIRRSQEIAKAKVKAARERGRELNEHETRIIERIKQDDFAAHSGGVHYRTIALLALTALTVCLVTVLSLDALGARAIANVTPVPQSTVTRYITPSTETESVIPKISITPTETPTIVPASVTPSVSATVSATPSPSADLSPTDTSTSIGATP